ncbi:unnamed protein product [Callosobruchus maculatus]|uniref:DAN domain-containing protein n=2 Tax=Callosobruchus maculatus TaxID=64391 RepID=A0A653DNA3_CALMS|nr:unnamed protein product [Callosobruchus maculatus]
MRYRILIFFGLTTTVYCEREHKVHNIVLYPEKHSWCQITPIQQIVGSPGYEPVTIDNNVCVGACYSYSIPKTQPAEPGELIGPYCDSCQPAEIKCYHVNLHRDEKSPDLPKILQKRVQIITNCSCQSCDKVRKDDCEITDENTLELPRSMFTDEKNQNKSTGDEVPELLERNDTKPASSETETDIKFKNKLKKWFEIYQNESESDQMKDDTDSEYYFQKFKSPVYHLGLEHNEQTNAKIEQALKSLPENFGVEGAPSHHKGSHIGMGIAHSQNDVVIQPEVKVLAESFGAQDRAEGAPSHHKGGLVGVEVSHSQNDVVVDDVVKKHHEHHDHHEDSRHQGHHGNHHHHMHHLGDQEQIGMNLVKLVRGPHGSMIATPVEAKLHIDSDALKPNSEGVVIDYENHHKNSDTLPEN